MTQEPGDLPRCSLLSRDHGEMMAGTALRGTRWLLVEHPGPWARKPLTTPQLAAGAGGRLADLAAAHDAQVVLVRRPVRRPPRPARSWVVVDHPSRTSVTGTWRSAADLDAAAEALALGPDHADAEPVSDGAHLLVCVHAKRDACCAQFGRPVALDLAARWPDRVWESSHLGGHRFAPTVLALPEGVHYGRLDRERAVDVIERHLAGDTDPSLLRGVTYAEPPVQAALVEALRVLGPGRPDDLDVTKLDAVADDEWVVGVRRRVGEGDVVVEVTRRVGIPAIQSCAATELVAPPQYLTRVRPL